MTVHRLSSTVVMTVHRLSWLNYSSVKEVIRANMTILGAWSLRITIYPIQSWVPIICDRRSDHGYPTCKLMIYGQKNGRCTEQKHQYCICLYCRFWCYSLFQKVTAVIEFSIKGLLSKLLWQVGLYDYVKVPAHKNKMQIWSQWIYGNHIYTVYQWLNTSNPHMYENLIFYSYVWLYK